MINITRNVAKYGCIVLLIVSTISLVLAIQESITWWIIISIAGILLYSFGLGIVIYDYKKYG